MEELTDAPRLLTTALVGEKRIGAALAPEDLAGLAGVPGLAGPGAADGGCHIEL